MIPKPSVAQVRQRNGKLTSTPCYGQFMITPACFSPPASIPEHSGQFRPTDAHSCVWFLKSRVESPDRDADTGALYVSSFVNFESAIPDLTSIPTSLRDVRVTVSFVNFTFRSRHHASRGTRQANVCLRVRFVNFARASPDHEPMPSGPSDVRFTVPSVNFTFPEPFGLFQRSDRSDVQSRVRFVNFDFAWAMLYNSPSATQSVLIPIDVRPQSDAQFGTRHHHPGAIPCQS